MDYKTKVRIALILKGKTQSQLADELDINMGYLSRLLQGKETPKKPHFKKINQILELDKLDKFLELLPEIFEEKGE